jgi:hypothetical protein
MSGNEDTENETCSSARRMGGSKQELSGIWLNIRRKMVTGTVLCSVLLVFVNCLSDETEYCFVNENSVVLIDGRNTEQSHFQL